MRLRAYKFAFLTALLVCPFAGTAAPAKSTNAVAPQEVRSVFVIPNSPKEGRDPFFPTATSLYQSAVPVHAAPTMSVESLKLVGILGNSLANINGVTLAVGETQEVKTSSGAISVRLLQIKPQDESVIVEANGQRRELKSGGGLTGKP